MTGSYIQPQDAPPLEGKALSNFLQAWFVGLLAIDPTAVRPRWQADPSNIPTAGDYWVAFGIRKRVADTYGMAQHFPDANEGFGADLRMRHETIDILVSFYDLGVNGQADALAALFADNVLIEQNRWPLDQNGFGILEVVEAIQAPSLFKERWQYRVDLGVVLRRQMRRIYPIHNVEKVNVNFHLDNLPVIVIEQVAAPPHIVQNDPGNIATTDQDGQTVNT